MKITIKEATKILKGLPKSTAMIAKRAATVAAHRTVRKLKKVSPVDRGGYRAAWKVKAGNIGRLERIGSLAVVENDNPIAGVIEKGARPHKVSREGVEAIRAWVIRKGLVKKRTRKVTAKDVLFGRSSGKIGSREAAGDFNAEVDEVVWAIVKKLEREGQEGLHLLENQVPESAQWFREELERLLAEEGKKAPK